MTSATVHASSPFPRQVARGRSSRGARVEHPVPNKSRRDVLFGLGNLTAVLSSPASSPASPLVPASRAIPSTVQEKRPGPEFETVVFPRYPGFVTLGSGVQVRDLCVPVDEATGANRKESEKMKAGDKVFVEFGMWTIHQGRNVVPAPTAGHKKTTSNQSFAFVIGDRTVIPGVEQAIVSGMRVGGVRRVLVPPKASVSYKYEPVTQAPTKYGMKPVQDVTVGAQVVDGTELPYPGTGNKMDTDSLDASRVDSSSTDALYAQPTDSSNADSSSLGADWLNYVLAKNAFTIKPTDRSVLFDLKLVEVVSGSDGLETGITRVGTTTRTRSSAGGTHESEGNKSYTEIRVATREDQVGEVNDSSEDGGASWWTVGLPKPRDYCP